MAHSANLYLSTFVNFPCLLVGRHRAKNYRKIIINKNRTSVEKYLKFLQLSIQSIFNRNSKNFIAQHRHRHECYCFDFGSGTHTFSWIRGKPVAFSIFLKFRKRTFLIILHPGAAYRTSNWIIKAKKSTKFQLEIQKFDNLPKKIKIQITNFSNSLKHRCILTHIPRPSKNFEKC